MYYLTMTIQWEKLGHRVQLRVTEQSGLWEA